MKFIFCEDEAHILNFYRQFATALMARIEGQHEAVFFDKPADAKAAIEAMGFSEEFYLVTDREMGGNSEAGIELIEAVRLKSQCSGCIMVTGIAQDEAEKVKSALAAKNINFLTKPLEPVELVSRIQADLAQAISPA